MFLDALLSGYYTSFISYEKESFNTSEKGEKELAILRLCNGNLLFGRTTMIRYALSPLKKLDERYTVHIFLLAPCHFFISSDGLNIKYQLNIFKRKEYILKKRQLKITISCIDTPLTAAYVDPHKFLYPLLSDPTARKFVRESLFYCDFIDLNKIIRMKRKRKDEW